jgi:hypothetical protein
MSETERNAHHTRREVATMGVTLTSAAIGTLLATSRGLAQNQGGNNQGQNGNNQGQNGGNGPRGAPAPAIGSGLSTVMVVAGLLLGANLFRRWGRTAKSE